MCPVHICIYIYIYILYMYVCKESMNSNRLAFGFPKALEKKAFGGVPMEAFTAPSAQPARTGERV